MTSDIEQINQDLLDALEYLADWIYLGPVKRDFEQFRDPLARAETVIANAKKKLPRVLIPKERAIMFCGKALRALASCCTAPPCCRLSLLPAPFP